jgi:hypothetical protein
MTVRPELVEASPERLLQAASRRGLYFSFQRIEEEGRCFDKLSTNGIGE